MPNQHVTYDSQKKIWKVIGAGNSKPTKTFATKQAAVGYARKIAQNQKTELVIHNKNGLIGDKDSHGKDSFPPKG